MLHLISTCFADRLSQLIVKQIGYADNHALEFKTDLSISTSIISKGTGNKTTSVSNSSISEVFPSE